MKKTKEQKEIEYLKQENLFLYIIKSIISNRDFYTRIYISLLKRNELDKAHEYKIKLDGIESRIDYYEKKLKRFKKLYDPKQQKYGNDLGRNKNIIMQIVQKFPEEFFSYNKKTELKYRFLKENKKKKFRQYTSGNPFTCEIRTKDTEELLLEIQTNSIYINFKFYSNKNNKYDLDSNVLEYILNLLKINNKVPSPAYGNPKHPFSKDTLDLHLNEHFVSFFVY